MNARDKELIHLVKLGDLDALEEVVLQSSDLIDVTSDYEQIFYMLDKRPRIPDGTTLAWARRYLAWIGKYKDRDPSPILGTEWARRTIQLALDVDNKPLAIEASTAIRHSYAPVGRETDQVG